MEKILKNNPEDGRATDGQVTDGRPKRQIDGPDAFGHVSRAPDEPDGAVVALAGSHMTAAEQESSEPEGTPGETAPDLGSSRQERVGKATYAITAFTMAGRLLGFVENTLVAKYAGGGSLAGAYFAATKFPWQVFGFGEQLLTHSFLPPFVEEREQHGEDCAWKMASVVICVQFLLLLIVVIGGVALAPWLVRISTSHFTPEELTLTSNLVRVMMPAVLLMSLSSLTYVILNAYKQFGLPAFGDAALKIAVVTTGFSLWHLLGIKAFAIGLVVGSCVKMATHLYGLRGKLRLVRWTLDIHDPAIRKLVVLMLPLMAGNILSFIRPILDTKFSGGTSQVAALSFAFKLTNLPFLLIPYALGIALFPFLAEMATRDDRKQIGRALITAVRMVTFLLLPITAVYIVLALPLVQTVYLHGRFTTEDSMRVVAPLVWYSIGMLPVGIETVVLQIFFSMSDTKTPTIVAYTTFVLYVVVAVVTTNGLGWGAAGVALALTVSKLVKDIILLRILTPRLRGLEVGDLGSFMGKISLATAAMVVVLWATLKFAFPALQTSMRPTVVASSAAVSAQASSGTRTPAGATGTPAPTPAPASPAAGATANGSPGATAAGATAAPGTRPASHKKPKKQSKFKAALEFSACAAPGGLVFLLVAYWLRIPELAMLYGVLERRIRPLFFKLSRFAMAPW